jgi:septation ring formation regulator EzrA
LFGSLSKWGIINERLFKGDQQFKVCRFVKGKEEQGMSCGSKKMHKAEKKLGKIEKKQSKVAKVLGKLEKQGAKAAKAVGKLEKKAAKAVD